MRACVYVCVFVLIVCCLLVLWTQILIILFIYLQLIEFFSYFFSYFPCSHSKPCSFVCWCVRFARVCTRTPMIHLGNNQNRYHKQNATHHRLSLLRTKTTSNLLFIQIKSSISHTIFPTAHSAQRIDGDLEIQIRSFGSDTATEPHRFEVLIIWNFILIQIPNNFVVVIASSAIRPHLSPFKWKIGQSLDRWSQSVKINKKTTTFKKYSCECVNSVTAKPTVNKYRSNATPSPQLETQHRTNMSTTTTPSSSAVRALALEYKSLQEEPVEGFRVKLLNDDNLFEWEVAIFGPPDTLYQGGYFKVRTFCTFFTHFLIVFRWLFKKICGG